jgi:hypothetical protein
MLRVVVAVVAVFIANFAQAKTVSLLLGGGGEEPGETTKFDTTCPTFIKTMLSKNYDLRVAFDGRHATLKKNIKAAVKDSHTASYLTVSPFSATRFNKEINRILTEVRENKLVKDDQVMIVVDSHGLPRGRRENTHRVSAEPGEVTLDTLRSLKTALESAGVKLAIIDLSCFSGNTQAFKSDKTCVISASSPDQPAYNSFTFKFADSLKSAKNLEEAFLLARKNDVITPSQPIISTKIGDASYDVLRAISPSFLTHEDAVKNMCINKPCACSPNNVAAQIANIDKILQQAPEAKVTNALRINLQRYQESKQKVEKELEFLNGPNSEQKVEVGGFQFSWAEIVNTDFASSRRAYQKLIDDPNTSPTDKKKYSEFNIVMRDLEKRVIDMEKNDLKYKAYSAAKSNYKYELKMLWNKATDVSAAERSVYEQLYQQFQKEEAGKPNPCAEFTL